MEEIQESQAASKKKMRKRPVKSEFHFPIYPLSVALGLAEKVEMQGNGTLSEAALAMALGESAKSSGFKLKVLTAKQFGLLVAQGGNLMSSSITKSIFKPYDDAEKAVALSQAFNNISLFKAISDKYEGSPLPSGEVLRNILEREFKVIHERVASAESMLINSAKTAGVLEESQGKVYLVRKSAGMPLRGERAGITPPPPPPPPGGGIERAVGAWNISVDTEDLAGMDAEAIKATMEGLANLAKILRQESTEEGEENNKVNK